MNGCLPWCQGLFSHVCEGLCQPVPPDPHSLWFSAEYLLWWLDQPTLPPLVTTAPTGTPVNVAGNLGTPLTTVLFGGSDPGVESSSGNAVAPAGGAAAGAPEGSDTGDTVADEVAALE